MIKNHDDSSESYGHGDMPFLVPLLDLTMILLFFFVIMSNAAQNVFDIKLPNADSNYQNSYIPTDADNQAIKLFIKADDLMINDTHYANIAEFKQAITKLIIAQTLQGKDIKDIKLSVASSKNVEVQKFLEIMTFLKSTGLEKVDILMDSKQAEG